MMSAENIKVRQIGDEKLHTIPVDADLTGVESIQNYISILKNVENGYGGVGIACNQCLEINVPVKIFLVGTDNEQTKQAAQQRYPHETIPDVTVMLNPKILFYSEKTYYPTYGEGCLSVLGPLRGKVKRHHAIAVRYQQLNGEIIEKEATGFEAHIIQHEYDHLQGIVYLQRIFKDCTVEQKTVIAALLEREIESRGENSHSPWQKTSESTLVFDRAGDQVIFEQEILSNTLKKLEYFTLSGINKMLMKHA